MKRGQHGFLLIGVLIALALAALGAVHTGQRFGDERQRRDEEELLFVGEQYRGAIQSYWRETPGGVHAWPARLEDLLEDRRFPNPKRHLRRLFADPLPPHAAWGLVTSGNGLVGVYSNADGVPFRQTGFGPAQRGFDGATRYADWTFVAAVPAAASAPVSAGTPVPRRPAPRGTR